jgi:hypothetical protein
VTGDMTECRIAFITPCRSRAARRLIEKPPELVAGPTACLVDSQSVKSAEKGGPRIDPHGGACPRALPIAYRNSANAFICGGLPRLGVAVKLHPPPFRYAAL